MEFVREENINISFKLAPGDKLFHCPYNRSHQVLESKAGSHLGVCRQAYVNKSPQTLKNKDADTIEKCRWLPSKHHLPASQLGAHEKICEGNKEKLFQKIREISATSTSAKPKLRSTSSSDYKMQQEEDDWE